MGNPVVKKIKNYRKTIVAKCKQLKYLDDRPVFEEERRRTEAWYKALQDTGSMDAAQEAERAELKLIRNEKDLADERNFLAFEKMMKEGIEIKKQREKDNHHMNSEFVFENSTSSINSFESSGPAVNPFSGEEIISVPESPALTEFREAKLNSILNVPSLDNTVNTKSSSTFMRLLTEVMEEQANDSHPVVNITSFEELD
jgi:dynein assembly factor 1